MRKAAEADGEELMVIDGQTSMGSDSTAFLGPRSVTFGEDLGCGAASGAGAAGLLILTQDTQLVGSIAGKRKQAGWNNDHLEALLLQITK